MTKSQSESNVFSFSELSNDIKSSNRDDLLIKYHSLLKDYSELEDKLKNMSSIKDGRKSQVLELLKEYDSISILEISNKLSISTKNVSSQLTYLRSDGYKIFTDHNGRKLLVD